MEEVDIEKWKIQKMIKKLDQFCGGGTSMISLIIPAGAQISQYTSRLTDEYGKSSNIKSRVNRLSVLAAITSTQQRLKLYNKTPKNGLVIFCGLATTDEGKEKKITIDFEPFKPISTTLYRCDNRFHTEPLQSLLKTDQEFGFIILGGDSTFLGVLAGDHKYEKLSFEVNLPKKHKKGGQSAQRFGRLQQEAVHNYLHKIGDAVKQSFISDDKPNVNGLVLAGPSEIKDKFAKSDFFDPRLKSILLGTYDIDYGGNKGFNRAIIASQNLLGDLKIIKERELLSKFFEEISKDSGDYCFGIKQTMYALDAGAVEDLIIWDDLDLVRYTITKGDEIEYVYYPEGGYVATEETQSWEISDAVPFTEWIVENFKNFGTKLNFVSDMSQEGSQFAKGFGGVGALLRYQLVFEDSFDEMDDIDDWDSDDFW